MEPLVGLLIFLAIGAAAGWLAGQIFKGDDFGLVGNIIVGVLGAIIGGFLAPFIGILPANPIGSIILATVGALILLAALRFLRKQKV